MKNGSGQPEVDGEELKTYALALSEINSGAVQPGIWAKAFAIADGDEARAKAAYIRMRVELGVANSPLSQEVSDEEKKGHAAASAVVPRDDAPGVKSSGAREVPGERPLAGPSGIGGWLLLLIVLLTVVGPIFGWMKMGGEFLIAEDAQPWLEYSTEWKRYKNASWLVFTISASVSVLAGLGLALERRTAAVTRAIVAMWVIGPGGNLLLALALPLLIFRSLDFFDESAGFRIFGILVASVIIAAAWTVYLTQSKRVANTYIDD